MDETLHDPGTDAEAVAAVRRGDAERYRELVERHERRVFAVAWSRLGDATLAEEATQEAFIRGYRRLWLLGDGAKFSGWIASVTRNVAINLGLRHRRELNKRERWALEHPPAENETAATETDPLHTPETLRQALVELPAAHRECLVLFYLEGKSGAEAATALGISEAALRVRLHRARVVLRERLEEKLAGSLAQLRPAKSLVPAIMAGVLASTSAKAATAGGVGATILGTLTKFAPFKWAFMLFPFLLALPTILFSWLMLRAEARNFRDAKGFRVRIFREDNLRRMVWMVVIFALMFLVLKGGRGRQDNFYLILAGIGVLNSLVCWRQVVLNRSRFFRVTFWSASIFSFTFGLIGLQVLPAPSLTLLILVNALAIMSVHRERPIRMDYNIFLRAAEGMLDSAATRSDSANVKKLFSKPDLLAYGRFLGSRWMADGYRWTAQGLRLRLPPVRFSLWNAVGLFNLFSPRSYLLLSYAGNVSPQLCRRDQKSLLALHPHNLPNADEMETQVASAVEAAWKNFHQGEFDQAERALGQLPEAELFVRPLANAGFPQWRTGILLVLLVLTLGLTGLRWFHPPWLEGMKPVSVTEAQVQQFFSLINTNPNPLIKEIVGGRESLTRKGKGFAWDPSMALFTCLVLPETNLLPASAIQAIRDSVAGGNGFEAWKQSPYRVQSVNSSGLPRRALTCGWIDWRDLNLQPSDLHDYLHTNRYGSYSREHWDYFLARYASWSWVKSERHEVLRINDGGVTQLRLFRDASSLDLVDREKLIVHIASVQALVVPPAGQPPIHDLKSVRGLFFTPCFPALLDTYFSLAALEILGGLDRIDREACIKGILKQHRGKGYFTSPDSGGYNEYHIDGSAQDTIAAYESLRILGALDRVTDLDKWLFRVNRRHLAANEVTWRDIEAWVAQKRLERILRERKENPNRSFRSLLEP